MDKIQLERLRAFANALCKQSDNIPYSKVSSTVQTRTSDSYTEEILPTFEWAFKFFKVYIEEMEGEMNESPISYALKYFGFETQSLFVHFFCVGLQQPDVWGGKRLGVDARGKDVAENILDFIRLAEESATI